MSRADQGFSESWELPETDPSKNATSSSIDWDDHEPARPDANANRPPPPKAAPADPLARTVTMAEAEAESPPAIPAITAPPALSRSSPDGSSPIPRDTPPPSSGTDADLSDLVGEEDFSASDEMTVDGAEPDHYVGTTLGDRYIIDKVLGEGGMGKVYRARHKVIEKKVAIKILHAELAKDKEAVGRFLREAKAASSIGNPHIVDIQDFGEADDGSTYFVMEYLNGASLGDLLEEKKRLPVNMVCDLTVQLCDGLAAAHEQQIVHRDLKPDNIILVKPSGTYAGQTHFCKILDFGIAKVSGHTDNQKLTMAGAVFGTPHYMSPEQAAGEAIDHRTDIYSLGVMMYEMVCGEMPFNADNFMGILTQHMYKPPPSLRSQPGMAGLPAGLEAIILKCLAKKREQRYQTMLELADDIRKLQTTGRPAADLTGPMPSMPAASLDEMELAANLKPKGRGLWWLAALAVVAAGVAVFVVQKSRAGAQAAADSAAVTAPAPSAAASERAVTIYAEPEEAYAIVEDKHITLPDAIPVPEGKTLSVRIEAGNDYESRTIEIDGSQPKVKVKLQKKNVAPPPPDSATPAVSTSAKSAPGAWPQKSAVPGPLPKTDPSKAKSTKKGHSGEGVVDPW